MNDSTEILPSRPAFSRWLSFSNDITQQFLAIGGDPDVVSLAGGLPAAEFYPSAEIGTAAERALTRWVGAALEYGPVEGFPALRRHIAERVSGQAGRAFSLGNVLLTAGAMQGLDLIGKVLIDRDAVVTVQFPTYVGALDAWRTRAPAYRLLDWSMNTGTGIDALRDSKLVYTVPDYFNPAGVLVPANERLALLEKVLAARTWLIEDDPYLPLHYDGPAVPSMLSMHGHIHNSGPYTGPVVYLGTLSKSIVPGLRVGWVVAAPEMI